MIYFGFIGFYLNIYKQRNVVCDEVNMLILVALVNVFSIEPQ